MATSDNIVIFVSIFNWTDRRILRGRNVELSNNPSYLPGRAPFLVSFPSIRATMETGNINQRPLERPIRSVAGICITWRLVMSCLNELARVSAGTVVSVGKPITEIPPRTQMNDVSLSLYTARPEMTTVTQLSRGT